MALALSAWSGHATAQDEYGDNDARTAARALAAQGSAAFEERDFERALALFERAGAIIPAPTITLMQARTLVELGRLVEALEHYAATTRMLSLDPSNEAFKEAAEAAERETGTLLERIPTLRVRIEGAVSGETLEIQVDGKKVAPALAAVDRPSDPGPHRIDVKTSLGRAATREVVLAERAHDDVVVELTPLPPPPPSAAPPAPEPRHDANPARTVGWTLMGAGAAFTATGAITGVLALNHKHDLDSVCTPGCPPSSAGTLDAYRRDRAISYTGFALGGLALAGGAYLIFSHSSRHVALVVSPNLVAVAAPFR